MTKNQEVNIFGDGNLRKNQTQDGSSNRMNDSSFDYLSGRNNTRYSNESKNLAPIANNLRGIVTRNLLRPNMKSTNGSKARDEICSKSLD